MYVWFVINLHLREKGFLDMKKGIHPTYHTIKIIMTDGTEFETRSTYGKEGEEMRLQVDPLTHPAYTGRRRELDTEGRVDKFRNRYGMKK
jgi:large subunit ribosomal protein L31